MTEEINGRLDTIEALLIQRIQEHREDNLRNSAWHLKKEVTVAHILSSLAVVALGVGSWFSLTAAVAALDTRTLNITDARITGVEAHVEATDNHMHEELGDIKVSLALINKKLDILEERTVENRK